jgi:peptide methionine sulfoxide reductase MsrA
MRKQVSFAIAAAILGLAVGFWTAIGVVDTSAGFGRSKAPAPTYRLIQVQPTAYLPGRSIEPVY